MNAKWMSGLIIAFASAFGLLVTSSKAIAADTLTLGSVTQVAGPQIQGKGTWSTAGTLVSITMYVNDPNNNNESTSAGVIDQTTQTWTWVSNSTAKGGLTAGMQYTVYAVMITKANGVQTTTTSTPLAITIAQAGGN